MTNTPWSFDSGHLALTVGRCLACGYEFFPPQVYGCESCGMDAEHLTTVSLPATGSVAASVIVQNHATHPTPYTVAEVELDGSRVTVQALLAGALAVGARVSGRVHDQETNGHFIFTADEGAR